MDFGQTIKNKKWTTFILSFAILQSNNHMKKNITIITSVVAIVVIIIAVYSFSFTNLASVISQTDSSSIKNGSYTIEGKLFQLQGGKISVPNPATGLNHTVEIFGEPVFGDVNNDGKKDAVILLASTPNKNGTFYYITLGIEKNGVYNITETLYIGHDIAPQTVRVEDGDAVFNYAERKAGDPVTAQASEGKSIWIHYNPETNQIGQLVKDFEGESATGKR